MDATLGALARLRRFAQAIMPTVGPIDAALPALRKLLEETQLPFKFVGGVAVVHHGYLRTTEDVDVLIDPSGPVVLAARAAGHGFAIVSRTRLKHIASGVVVDLLIAGDPMPRPGSPFYPAPDTLAASPDDAHIVGFVPLLELKLRSHRHRDLADIVELLQPLDDARYLAVEAAITRDMRHELAELRRDALEELRFRT